MDGKCPGTGTRAGRVWVLMSVGVYVSREDFGVGSDMEALWRDVEMGLYGI